MLRKTFQRYIDRALGDLPFVFPFVDDILVASSSPEEHMEHLKIVFGRLEQYHLRLNLEKCKFGVSELIFLGHLVNSEGYRPPPGKVQDVLDFPLPKTIDKLRRFLGIVNFYRRSIPHSAETQIPLNKYLCGARKKDKRPIDLSPEAIAAFEKCKSDLANATLMAHPDPDAEIRVCSDASDFAMGASLEQLSDGHWRPLAFFSRKFTPAQVKYSVYDRELTAAYEAVKHFRYYLEGREFVICTDHKPLIYALAQDIDTALPRPSRQLSYIAQFACKFDYVPGPENVVADSFSRVDAFRLPTQFDLRQLAQEQEEGRGTG